MSMPSNEQLYRGFLFGIPISGIAIRSGFSEADEPLGQNAEIAKEVLTAATEHSELIVTPIYRISLTIIKYIGLPLTEPVTVNPKNNGWCANGVSGYDYSQIPEACKMKDRLLLYFGEVGVRKFLDLKDRDLDALLSVYKVE
ncbi:MAG: hypothetical protein V1740_05100 [Candidatus Woesearchaeota archaeon]